MRSAQVSKFDAPWSWRLACAGVAVFAFVLVWVCGHRGLFLEDQSMVFDGAWRLLQGQIPYRDSLYPFGPVTFAIQALFFKLLGVTFSAMVTSAATLNAIAALVSIRIVRLALPEQKRMALTTGLATACWFQAPFGTLWLEQTAFFFSLISLWAALESERFTAPVAYSLHAVAGASLALAVLSKQNAGLLFFPVLAGTVIVLHFREARATLARLAVQMAGFLAIAGCFLLWLRLFSDPRQYFHYSIEITRSLAAERAPQGAVSLLNGLVAFSALAPALRLCASLVAVLGAAALIAGLARWPKSPSHARTCALAGWLIVSCLEFQQLFNSVTENEASNGVPFIGLACGLALGLLSLLLGKGFRLSVESGAGSLESAMSGRTGRRIVAAAAVLVWGTLILQGLRVSWNRSVQEFAIGTRFDETLNVEGLHRAKWADFDYSSRLGLSTNGNSGSGAKWWLRKSDFEGLNEWLAQTPGNFFLFGDATMLYGLHRRPSPQPWLYFLAGHSYLRTDLARVDEITVESLSHKEIQTVILEKVSWSGGQDTDWLPHMPRLQEWIFTNFHKEREFGIYEVWVRSAPPTHATSWPSQPAATRPN